jgi:hypothetical protein
MSKGGFRKVCRGLWIISYSNQTNSIQIKSIQNYGNGVL